MVCLGVWPLSLALLASWQGLHMLVRLSGSSLPPLALGFMWSTSVAGVGLPRSMQAVHRYPSRLRIWTRSFCQRQPYPRSVVVPRWPCHPPGWDTSDYCAGISLASWVI